METRTVEQVESWSTRSFSDGFAGLRELSDGEFSGAVRANGAWLFMLNGRIIGVYEGSLDDFESADGTAYAAPHPSLPLLFSMQERGGDTRAKYYTNDTPLSEVDSTLTDGSFTGYVELSENVLSGDYYVAYYGGRSMSVAFVGASEQVVTGDEAFERAADEVGIYEVTDVELEVTDVPEPEDDEPDAPSSAPSSESTGESASDPSGGVSGAPTTEAGDAPSGGSSSDAGKVGPADGRAEQVASRQSATESPASESSAAESPAGQTSAGGAGPAADTEPGRSATDAGRRPDAGSETPESERAAEADAPTATDSTPAEPTPTESKSSAEPTTSETTDATATRETRAEATPGREDSVAASDGAASGAASAGAAESDSSDGEADAFAEEAEWRETTTIPSLDPDRSEGPDETESRQGSASTAGGANAAGSTASGSASGAGPSSSGDANRTADSSSATGGGRSQASASDGASTQPQSSSRTASSSGAESAKSSSSPEGKASGAGDSGGADDARARIKKLRSQLQQRKQQVQQLKERLSKVESQRDEFKRERDTLSQEVERLEAQLEAAESGGASADGRRLSSAEAFDGTNLFVRYQSKGKATLEEAAAGEADPEDVNANLRLEHHTQFETDGATVEGRAFEEFLTDSFEYRFVSWLVEDLLYEIRDTGHRSSLQDLYEAIPKVDRVDLHGSVSAGGEDEDTRKESFDVIARDRMGNPLLVADLNDSRDPTTGDMMGSLVDAASGVGEAHDELSGAFQVTESFFEPEALETADTATTGGFLSREKRESFVKLSRKRGYHLCLVESRSGGFHLNVPEL